MIFIKYTGVDTKTITFFAHYEIYLIERKSWRE